MLRKSRKKEDVDEIALFTNGDENQSGWRIDSGATQQMTHKRDNLCMWNLRDRARQV